MRYLRKRLEDVKVVEYSLRFRIVGYDEIHGRNDYISLDSPMARALLKKEEGDEVVVHPPRVRQPGTSTASATRVAMPDRPLPAPVPLLRSAHR